MCGNFDGEGAETHRGHNLFFARKYFLIPPPPHTHTHILFISIHRELQIIEAE